jgi:hypothetical protein
MMMEELFLGVMELQDAKNHQARLKSQGIVINFRTNPQTCGTGGCKVSVEVWGSEGDRPALEQHFQRDYLKHVQGHAPNVELLSQVFDPTLAEVVCQACGAKFNPSGNECPDCGLCY